VTDDNPWIVDRGTSPGGRYLVRVEQSEARMSHWIDTPRIIDVGSGEVVFVLRDTRWSLDAAEWMAEDHVRFTLRRYPGDHTPSAFVADLRLSDRQATVDGVGVPLADAEAALNAWADRSKRPR
jgi:hypothetical protein